MVYGAITALCCVIVCGAIISSMFLICGTITSAVSCDGMFRKQMTILLVYIKVKFSPVFFFDRQFSSLKPP